MITQGNWSVAPRIGKYQVLPGNEEERIALEKIGGITFEALSVGTRNGQVAIIPLDESNRDNANLIVSAPKLLNALRHIQERMYANERFSSKELELIVLEALNDTKGL
jgi:hypothetical protein